ncbi:hypothetical protein ACFWA5_21615 [Streptomyces mirabilis]|uniref:hypothetical protein n=1 Tax=Streptomyces mirabilis TaxID=68239 RepID=UPI00365E83E5
MNASPGGPSDFADFEVTFGHERCALVARNVAAAPRFTPEQILSGRAISATFRVPPLERTEGHRDAEEE